MIPNANNMLPVLGINNVVGQRPVPTGFDILDGALDGGLDFGDVLLYTGNLASEALFRTASGLLKSNTPEHAITHVSGHKELDVHVCQKYERWVKRPMRQWHDRCFFIDNRLECSVSRWLDTITEILRNRRDSALIVDGIDLLRDTFQGLTVAGVRMLFEGLADIARRFRITLIMSEYYENTLTAPNHQQRNDDSYQASSEHLYKVPDVRVNITRGQVTLRDGYRNIYVTYEPGPSNL